MLGFTWWNELLNLQEATRLKWGKQSVAAYFKCYFKFASCSKNKVKTSIQEKYHFFMNKKYIELENQHKMYHAAQAADSDTPLNNTL